MLPLLLRLLLLGYTFVEAVDASDLVAVFVCRNQEHDRVVAVRTVGGSRIFRMKLCRALFELPD